MRDIADIISDWKSYCGKVYYGKCGPFLGINHRTRKDDLCDLIKTFIDEGHTPETIQSTQTRNMAIEACIAPVEAKSPKRKVQQQCTARDWSVAIKEFYRGPISTYVRPDRPEREVAPPVAPAKEFDYSKVEIEPKDMIKVDQTGFAETQYDLDFLEELGLDPKKVIK